MNGQFVGTFINAGYIAILAPCHSSLHSMLTICDTGKYHLKLNPTNESIKNFHSYLKMSTLKLPKNVSF